MEQKKPYPLYSSRNGIWLRILALPSGKARSQLIRLGLNEGEKIFCVHRLPGGTMVIRKNRQQIAIGGALARQIMVTLVGSISDEMSSTA